MKKKSNQFTKLRLGHIVGVVDSYGAVHSEFTGERVAHHTDFWQTRHCLWRWNFDQGIWWISPETRPNDEQFEAIQNHLTKKFGIKWWENGYHDLDHFMAQLTKDRKALTSHRK